MALWLVRGGRHGEHEERFFENGQVCLTWRGIENESLEEITSFDAMRAFLTKKYPERSAGWTSQNTSQFWSFRSRIKVGDLVVTPRKGKAAVAIGTVMGAYKFDPSASSMYRHMRPVQWLKLDFPRSGFEQDLLYSFGAYTTICEIKRNDAEQRVREKIKFGASAKLAPPMVKDAGEMEASQADDALVDVVRFARDQIAEHLERQFTGHALARLVGAILEAQGYTTYVSPAGPDKGIDILAAPGPLGFGRPRICVQVKSGASQVDRPTLDQLVGAMSNVGAEQGLLVSWGGFKNSVDKEEAIQFFRVRLWDSDAVIEQLLANYDKLSDELRAEIPLQRVWALVASGSAEQE
jgi:restriction system protein